MYVVNVSSLNVRKKPSNPDSRVMLKKNTTVKIVGPPVKYGGEKWVNIVTVNKPVIGGYVQAKYLLKLL